jgi:hypothetical protein
MGAAQLTVAAERGANRRSLDVHRRRARPLNLALGSNGREIKLGRRHFSWVQADPSRAAQRTDARRAGVRCRRDPAAQIRGRAQHHR